ncbi:NAD(P)H oxidoreductase [Budviciaceae bacterium BWR-B9]|uniref:NAD(P)H oxidoreductase n=1 Tax=Limnobaculum allomyrinae TaxID=2791986 RepID=A0ABS1IRG2_9GAMM|nr:MULTISPECIES: NAD(P)H oxidoreductase [Limnobaculum]MBK5143905.1 NAD(P)H oxidoreductase [Limnobaculum allomyrinae]MBV7691564.1 NAD(P)H oxidoreductase [Limnobaculum sp. M2-1]
MKSQNMYIIWSHPRADSLTAKIVEEIQGEATRNDINVTTLDLYRRGFNPVLEQDDEPDWQNPQKQYTPEVHQLFGELQDKDTLVFVFPLWWYSFPAMIKGYLDRVWNHGLAYGKGSSLAGKKIRWVALIGGSEDKFIEYGWCKNITDFLNGAASYLGIEDNGITFLYNTIGVEEDIGDNQSHYESLFEKSRRIVDTLL